MHIEAMKEKIRKLCVVLLEKEKIEEIMSIVVSMLNPLPSPDKLPFLFEALPKIGDLFDQPKKMALRTNLQALQEPLLTMIKRSVSSEQNAKAHANSILSQLQEKMADSDFDFNKQGSSFICAYLKERIQDKPYDFDLETDLMLFKYQRTTFEKFNELSENILGVISEFVESSYEAKDLNSEEWAKLEKKWDEKLHAPNPDLIFQAALKKELKKIADQLQNPWMLGIKGLSDLKILGATEDEDKTYKLKKSFEITALYKEALQKDAQKIITSWSKEEATPPVSLVGVNIESCVELVVQSLITNWTQASAHLAFQMFKNRSDQAQVEDAKGIERFAVHPSAY